MSAVFFGRGVADGVGEVDRRRAGADRLIDAAAEIVDRGAGRVHRRPFDVVDEVARLRDGRLDDLHHLVLALPHLVREVDRRGGDEGVDARPFRVPHRLAGARDVGGDGAGEPGDDGVLHAPRDLADRLEIALRGDREARLDDVDAHLVEEVGDFQLFLERHGRAGALLAVAERGVEDHHAIPVAFANAVFPLISSVLQDRGGAFGRMSRRSALGIVSPEGPPCAVHSRNPGCRRSGAPKKESEDERKAARGARFHKLQRQNVEPHDRPSKNVESSSTCFADVLQRCRPTTKSKAVGSYSHFVTEQTENRQT